MTKSEYTEAIKSLGDAYGSELVKMMEYYNVFGLRDLSLEQIKEYYEKVIIEKQKQEG